jgi:hypothetical protein
MGLNFYFREGGPVCYETSLFENENELDYFIQTFLASDLSWYWISEREWEAAEEYKLWNLPKIRGLTLLNKETESTLYQDFLEEDIDMRRRTVIIFGIEKNQEILSGNDLKNKIYGFLKNENVAVKCVINQINDMKSQYTFVPGNPIDEMQNLLNKWGLKRNSVTITYKYKQLHLARLEDVIKSGIVEMAFP